MRKIALLSVLAMTLVLTGCSLVPQKPANQNQSVVPEKSANQNQPANQNEGPVPQPKSNLFKLEDVKVGDSVADMQIKFIGKFSDTITPYQSGSLSENNVIVKFSGSTMVTGQYEYQKISDFGGIEQLCFGSLDAISEKSMPKLYSSSNNPTYFCITNISQAKNALGLTTDSKGSATIVVNDYVLNSYPSEVFNTATLVSLVKK